MRSTIRGGHLICTWMCQCTKHEPWVGIRHSQLNPPAAWILPILPGMHGPSGSSSRHKAAHRRMRSSQSASWYLAHPAVMLVHAVSHCASASCCRPCKMEVGSARCSSA